MRSMKFDIQVLVVCVIVVGLSVLITPSSEVLTLWGYELPPMCTYKALFGFECLGCGLTRSFTFMGHFAWADAWGMNRLGPALWLIVAAQIPYRGAQILRQYVVHVRGSRS